MVAGKVQVAKATTAGKVGAAKAMVVGKVQVAKATTAGKVGAAKAMVAGKVQVAKATVAAKAAVPSLSLSQALSITMPQAREIIRRATPDWLT